MPTAARYRTITREQFLLRETRLVARMRLDDGASNEQILAAAVERNVFQYPTLRMVKNIASVCLARLDALSPDPDLRADLTGLLAHAAPETAAQANLYAMMRAYRVVWEFMLDVVAVKRRALDDSLTLRDVNAFLTDLARTQPQVGAWSDLTLQKTRQVLVRSLVDAGLAERSARPGWDYALVPAFPEPALARAMRANGDPEALAAFGCTAEVL